jgi:phage-related protein
MTWPIEFYRKENGKSPVWEFINDLHPKFQAKAIRQIEMLEQFGTDLKEPYVKPINGDECKGLWELRIKFANDISRIFYFMPVGNCFVLLHGFVKKTDKIPKKELEMAKSCKADYLRRRQNG